MGYCCALKTHYTIQVYCDCGARATPAIGISQGHSCYWNFSDREYILLKLPDLHTICFPEGSSQHPAR